MTQTATRIPASNFLVGQRVIELLGKPLGFYKVTSTRISKRAFRVNVYCEDNDSSCVVKAYKITHSYYVVLTGSDVACTPPILLKESL